MHTEREPVDLDSLSEMGYEKRDVNFPSLRNWIIAFFALILVFSGAAYLFYMWLAPHQNWMGKTKYVPQVRRVPPAPNPLLQNNVETKVDIQRLRQDEVSLLTSYGWVDQNAGVVRMPIERAKELIAERGADTGPTSVAPVRRPDASPRDITGQGPADKPSGGANAGDTAPRTTIPTENPARNPEQNGGVTNAPTGPNAPPSNTSQGTSSAPAGAGAGAGATGAANGSRE